MGSPVGEGESSAEFPVALGRDGNACTLQGQQLLQECSSLIKTGGMWECFKIPSDYHGL